MQQNFIKIRGAREHNLKNVDVDIPKDKLVVITGVSGSGKSSLAFDTLYAEGQRRYVESLSAYARQFLDMMQKPDVDIIEGLCPAISIEQKTTSKNPRSTVATVTEIYDYMRVLWARVGVPHSPATGLPIEPQSVSQMVDRIMALPEKTRIYLIAPVARGRKGEYKTEFEALKKQGFLRVKVDGILYEIDRVPVLNKNAIHDIEVIVDRLVIEGDIQRRLSESIETILKLSNGLLYVENADNAQEKWVFSSRFSCPVSDFTLNEVEPRLFSFNSPQGACPTCDGLGKTSSNVDLDDMLEDFHGSWRRFGIDQECPDCKGDRLKPDALTVKIAGKHIAEVTRLSVTAARAWFAAVPQQLSEMQNQIAEKVLKEIIARLSFLDNVGLDYLSLNRESGTLSGGEGQRIRLASQIGSGLTGVLYVLDEPSIGLHQRDNDRLLESLKQLRDLGNSIIVVEHDEDTMREADYIVDMGPLAGTHGGEVVALGTALELEANPKSLTGKYLSGVEEIPIPKARSQGNKNKAIKLEGVTTHNLKNATITIPEGLLTCITGVSGSGKSSLIIDTLYHIAAKRLSGAQVKQGNYQSISGLEYFDKAIEIDQSPIGRTPRSNPVTYIGVYTFIRDWYAGLPESKARGYKPGRFSFNVKGGRCEKCEGDGMLRIEMHFLPDTFVVCDSCNGKRFNRETLEITYKDKNIAEILEMTIEEALLFFANIPHIAAKLQVLNQVGLGYLHCGQSATHLSGGEAQRVKLAKELSRTISGKTLYILDEPTTGLHVHDVKQLLSVLDMLKEQGNTIVVIEHNLEVIKTADWVIDLGPEGGDKGGRVVAVGTPEDIANNPKSITGSYLKQIFLPKQKRA